MPHVLNNPEGMTFGADDLFAIFMQSTGKPRNECKNRLKEFIPGFAKRYTPGAGSEAPSSCASEQPSEAPTSSARVSVGVFLTHLSYMF